MRGILVAFGVLVAACGSGEESEPGGEPAAGGETVEAAPVESAEPTPVEPAPPEPPPVEPVATEPAVAATPLEVGQAFYMAACASCHAPDGRPVREQTEHRPRRSIAARRIASVDALRERIAWINSFRHPSPGPDDWPPLAEFLRTIGTLR